MANGRKNGYALLMIPYPFRKQRLWPDDLLSSKKGYFDGKNNEYHPHDPIEPVADG